MRVLVVLAGVSVVGCESGRAPLTRALVVAQASDPESLDPGLTTSSEAAQILAQIYEPLVRHEGGPGGIVPCLAIRWEVSKDGTRWVFHLRRNVRFHDGTPFDADAVVFSFERQRDRNHPFFSAKFAYWRTAFGYVVHTRKVDRYTVEVKTAQPFAPFLSNLAMFPVSIVSPRTRHSAGTNRPVGTGPYRFRSWRRGARVVLERNPDYWGGSPRIPRLVFSVVREGHQRLNGLQSGTIDLIYGVAPEDRAIVQLHPDLRLLPAGAANVAYLAMNTRRPPFDDVRVRRALNHAIDKSLIIKLGYQGQAQPAHGPIPPRMWSYTDKLTHYGYNPAKARALLAEAGFPSARHFRLRVMSTPRPYLPSPVLVARIIAHNLEAVGVKVDVISRPHAEHVQAMRKGDHDLGLLGWVTDTGDPDNFLYVLLDSDNTERGSAQNVAFFRDPPLHELLLQARQEMRRSVRGDIYRRAQRRIAEQAPWVPLAHAEVSIAVRRGLQAVGIDPTNTLDFRRVAF